MKLKLIVALMSVLGLVSMPAFAADDTTSTQMQSTQSSVQTQTPSKTKYHHHKKHKQHTEAWQYKGDYKGMAMPVIMDIHQMIYDRMSQNTGRINPAPTLFNSIGVSGGLNVDGHWGSRQQGFMGENYVRGSVNDAYVNFNAVVSDWSKAFMSLSYSKFTGTTPEGVNGYYGGAYSHAYDNRHLNMEQGYITFANYEVSPIFVQVGKQFADYGRYTTHPLFRSMNQVMTESLQESAKLGFITDMGIHGDVSAFNNPSVAYFNGHSDVVYGAALGYDHIDDQLGYDVGVGYMSNLTGVNDIRDMLANTYFGAHNYVHTVGGLAFYGDLNSGPFSLALRYTRSIQSFYPDDLSTQFGTYDGSGAKPWAADITVGYNFNAWSKSQNAYLGYQVSNNAVNLALPKNRVLIGYNVELYKNFNVGVEWDHDNSYSASYGGSGSNYNAIGARASVKFG